VNDGNVATHTAYFSVEGATIIERYCDTCLKAIGEPSNARRLDDTRTNEKQTII
jgi:hypothetical protein